MVLNDSRIPHNPNPSLTYRVFGHTMVCDRPLPGWLTTTAGSPDLSLTFVTVPPFDWDPTQHTPAFLSQTKSKDGLSLLTLYRQEGCEIIRFREMADFYIWADRIECYLLQELPLHLTNSLLFANVLPFWLELNGFITIHASAVTLATKAIAFVAHSRNGKSTLAAALLQDGCALLTDDVLPISRQPRDRQASCYWANPGYPAMRMWPGEAGHFLSSYEELERVNPEYTKRYVPINEQAFGAFYDQPCPVGRIYILERQEASNLPDGLEIRSVTHRDAVIELLRYSFVTRMAEAAGLAPGRFDFLAGLVQAVPIRRLIYPSGYEHLPQIRQAILADR